MGRNGWLLVAVAALVLVGAGVLLATGHPEARVAVESLDLEPSVVTEAVGEETSVEFPPPAPTPEPPRSPDPWGNFDCQVDAVVVKFYNESGTYFWQRLALSESWPDALRARGRNFLVETPDGEEWRAWPIPMVPLSALSTVEFGWMYNTSGYLGKIRGGKPEVAYPFNCHLVQEEPVWAQPEDLDLIGSHTVFYTGTMGLWGFTSEFYSGVKLDPDGFAWVFQNAKTRWEDNGFIGGGSTSHGSYKIDSIGGISWDTFYGGTDTLNLGFTLPFTTEIVVRTTWFGRDVGGEPRNQRFVLWHDAYDGIAMLEGW